MRVLIAGLLCLLPFTGTFAKGAIQAVTPDLPPLEMPEGKESNSQVATVDNLIRATKESLRQQERIRALIIEFETSAEAFLRDDTSVPKASHMVTAARDALEAIQEAHLTPLFDPNFLEGLKDLGYVASKRGPSRP